MEFLPSAVPETLTICSENGPFEPPLNISTHTSSVSPSLILYTRFRNPRTGGSRTASVKQAMCEVMHGAKRFVDY